MRKISAFLGLLFMAAALVASAVVLPIRIVSSTSITADVQASRTTGVAPLCVFFDATATVSTAQNTVALAYTNLDYTWTFDDSGAGTWLDTGQGTTLRSKNYAQGPVAAHCYETAGTYNPVVTVRNSAGETHTDTVQIAVTAAADTASLSGANVVCVSTDGVFTGAPASCTQVTTSSLSTAMGNLSSTKKKIVFKCGQSWTGSYELQLAGPGIIGSWSNGACGTKPIAVQLNFGDRAIPGTVTDWRVMDMQFNGAGAGNGAIGIDGTVSRIAMLRVDIANAGTGINWSEDILTFYNTNGFPGHTLPDETYFVDSTITTTAGTSGNNGLYLSSLRVAVMGCTIDPNGGGEHGLRAPHISRYVIAHNIIQDAAAGKSSLTVRAPPWAGDSLRAANTYAEKGYIGHNKLTANANTYPLDCGPQDTSSVDERSRYVIIDGNWVIGGASTASAIHNRCNNTTIRNNVIDLTLGGMGIELLEYGAGSPTDPSVMEVYNNTIYSGSSGGFTGLSKDANVSSVTVRNNLGYAPSSSSRSMTNGSMTESNNSSDAQILINPNFTGTTTPADFDPNSASYPIDGGITVEVMRDHQGALRTGTYDIGAVNP